MNANGKQFRPFRTRTPVVLGVIGLLLTVAFWGLTRHSRKETSSTPPDVLIPRSESLELGLVWCQQAYQHTVQLENRSRRPVRITKIFPSCRCTSVVPEQLTVPPNDTGQFQLNIDLTDYDAGLANLRTFTEDLVVRFATDEATRQEATQRLTLTGTVQSLIAYHPTRVLLASLRRDSITTRAIHVATTGNVQKLFLAGDDAPAGLSFSTSRTDNGFEVVIECTGDLFPRGATEREFNVQAQLTDGSLIDVPNLPVSIVIPHLVTAFPREISFGVVDENQRCSEPLQLVSTSSTPFRILAIEGPEDVQCTLKESAEFADRQTLQVTIPSVTKAISGRLTIRVASETGERDVLSLPVQAYATTPVRVDNPFVPN